MTDQDRIAASDPAWGRLMSEPESHTEHQAALDATLFRACDASEELVLELDSGTLRVRPSLGG